MPAKRWLLEEQSNNFTMADILIKEQNKKNKTKNLPALGYSVVFCKMDLGITQLSHFFPGILLNDLK